MKFRSDVSFLLIIQRNIKRFSVDEDVTKTNDGYTEITTRKLKIQ